jgi:hypothetical protein
MSINEIAKCCEVCGYSSCELFGHRLSDGWRWFCAAHRLGQFYADKRSPAPDDGVDR